MVTCTYCALLSQIDTGDQSRCHHFEPENERQKQEVYVPPKMSEAVHTSHADIILCERSPACWISGSWGHIVIKKLYTFWDARLSQNALFLGNSHPHTVECGRNTSQRFGWETLHPKILSMRFLQFWRVEERHSWTTFCITDVCVWIKIWLRRTPRRFFKNVSFCLVIRYMYEQINFYVINVLLYLLSPEPFQFDSPLDLVIKFVYFAGTGI